MSLRSHRQATSTAVSIHSLYNEVLKKQNISGTSRFDSKKVLLLYVSYIHSIHHRV